MHQGSGHTESKTLIGASQSSLDRLEQIEQNMRSVASPQMVDTTIYPLKSELKVKSFIIKASRRFRLVDVSGPFKVTKKARSELLLVTKLQH